MKSNFITKTEAYVEKKPVWILGFLLLCLSFLPCLILGEKSIFFTHEQYDGALLTYILNAKYLFESTTTYPEWLGGVPTSGMTVAAPLLILLYRFLEPAWAFIAQYILLSIVGFVGMYLCMYRFVKHKCISCVVALLFALLPFMPIYGHSAVGAPLLIYAFICLYEKKHLPFAYFSLIFFGLTSSLVMLGYAYLAVGGILCVVFFFKKKKVKHFYLGYLLLIATYILTNLSLIMDIFNPASSFVSHREEFVLNPLPFGEAFMYAFLNQDIYAPAYNRYLIVPVLLVQLIQTFRYKHLSDKEKWVFKFTWGCYALIIFLCFQYALFYWEPVVSLRNHLPSMIKHFQFHRVYMLIPMLWYFMAGFCLWQIWQAYIHTTKKLTSLLVSFCKLALMCLFIFMTAVTIRRASVYRLNLNQVQNPYMDFGTSFSEYFIEDVYSQIEDYIGKEQSSYKVASLGIDPAIAMYNGFYCIDGYSNNYPLSYKHAFRKIIEKEIEKSEALQFYFDGWGSRCYLFAAETYTSYSIKKSSNFVYQDLELNSDALKELGCDYLFAAAPIEDAAQMELVLLNSFTSDSSAYTIYLYEVN